MVGGAEQAGAKAPAKRWKLTRATRTHVWIIPYGYGACSRARQRGLSRRIEIEEFRRDWLRLPQREVMKKADFERGMAAYFKEQYEN